MEGVLKVPVGWEERMDPKPELDPQGTEMVAGELTRDILNQLRHSGGY